MFALDQNNENELLESILNLKNLVDKKMANQITKQKTHWMNFGVYNYVE